ncbi:hypothetical protein EDF73_103154 [Raoultella sp. BIGb0138]|nr:hypothetical protein EDF73_103154 [Raoultella sp. BIGb0138]
MIALSYKKSILNGVFQHLLIGKTYLIDCQRHVEFA